jgi:hypothetical chaperone protein
MIIGMDFGTTNSGMAWHDGRTLQVLPLDPANNNPRVARTALYITNDQQVAIGREAVDRYFAENSGRPVKIQKVWVGEIEVVADEMYYVDDVYVWVDVFSPGRLFLSIKTALRDPDYRGTVIGQFYYPLEDLVALYLSLTRLRAERLLGRELRRVVLGRPVHFAHDAAGDALAQQRLLTAAFRAGYDEVYLQYEPVAAAYHYAAGQERPQNILVFDFGGGTLDLTIMRLEGQQRREVLATGGIPVAGDLFDQKLVRAKLPVHFGEGSLYGERGKELPVPGWIYDLFANWQTIIELQTPENRQMLRDIAQTARKKRPLEALISLVTNNYSLQMFDLVEQAKRQLSERVGALIHLQGPDFNVYEMVTRQEFEQIIQHEIQAIEAHLLETVQMSGLRPSQIDAVIRTGGSAQIPVFVSMLERHFGADKVVSMDTFSSVTAGLGIYAQGISSGAIAATAYRPADLATRSLDGERTNVPAVNLHLLQQRLAIQEDRAAGIAVAEEIAVVLFPSGLNPRAVMQPAAHLAPDYYGDVLLDPATEPEQAPDLGWGLTAAPDEQLLLASNKYRFFLITPRQMRELAAVGLTLSDYLHLGSNEYICAGGLWVAVSHQPKLLLVTSQGYTRAYHLALLREVIEGPTPLQFDEPLPGQPLALLGVEDRDQVLVMLDSSRAARWPVSQIPLRGLQAIHRRPEETAVAAVLAQPDQELIVVTQTGHGQRLLAGAVTVPAKANQRGRVTVSRGSVCGLICRPAAGPLRLISVDRLIAVDPDRIPRDDPPSTRAYPISELPRGARLIGLLS